MKTTLLMNLSGENQPGITAKVSSLLAEHALTILDIDQAVIHNVFSMVILVEVSHSSDVHVMQKNIECSIRDMGMEISCQILEPDAINEWVSSLRQDLYIVTLLGRKVLTGHISRVSAITAEYGLNIDKIKRLSGSLSEGAGQAGGRACIEFSVRGKSADLPGLRKRLLDLMLELDVDIAFQENNIYRRNRRLVVFDMDSTLIEAEVIDELAKHAGVGEQVARITEAAMAGEIDFKESFSRRMALLKGLDESVLEDVANCLKITEGAERLITTLRKLGYKTAIISGGFNYFANVIKQRLGMDYVYANKLEIVDGKVTGAVVGEVVDGKRKAELLKAIAAKEGVSLEQVIAVGDGANDLPMLSIAGLGIAFRAKPLVKASAKQSISNLGLDGILYLMGFTDDDIQGL